MRSQTANVDEKTLQEIFLSIDSSPSPELELKYLTEEFDFRTDELFFLYSDYKRKAQALSRKFAWNLNSVRLFLNAVEQTIYSASSAVSSRFRPRRAVTLIVEKSEALPVERRKSPPQFRLKYGLTKLLNEFHSTSRSKLKNNTDADVQELLNEELCKYRFRRKKTFEDISTSEVLEGVRLSDFDVLDLTLFVDALTERILQRFDIYYLPRTGSQC
jgi:hypothetical protein